MTAGPIRDGAPDAAPAPEDAIAVIGMAGRFPGARNLAEYWRNLRDGVESIVPLGEDELRRSGIDADALDDRNYIRSGAPLDGIDEFDAALFGFTPAVAEGLDPQHRLFLQCTWHAIEDAGYRPDELAGAVGVYGTSSASGYLLNNLMSRVDVQRTIGQGASYEMVDLSLRNDKDHVATRIAHQFDLHGPALSVQTACSSSAVAVHLACQALLSGEVDAALAGGSSIRVPNRAGYWHTTGAMTSPSGHCRPFDVRADGTVFGSGVGVVLLKTLERALADGDRVHAVIRGSAINNDGAAKMTYAAPTAAGQAAAIAEAHAVAGVDPADIGYVETHGTGTPLGDPIEIDGLRQAFELSERPRSSPCRLGSVKANIGHLEVASGIAGVLKTILALKHRALPGTLHYTAPNPELRLGDGPFEVNQDLVAWESDGPRLAGVSSFGVGGTNVHLVLEEAPAPRETAGAPASGPYPLLLSARGSERLAVARGLLADELEADEDPDLADVAATLAARPADNTRGVTVVRDRAHAIAALRAGEGTAGTVPDGSAGANDRVALLFPGQGAQYVGMARGLYDAEPVFAQNLDRCAAGFDAALGIDLRALLFEGRSRELERTDRSQAALFTVEYALARLLESRGVVPSILVGHSVGEYVAATLAGVFDLPTAISVVAERGRVMAAAPRGTMLAVPLGVREIAPYLGSEIDVATVNEPGACVVAGPDEAIAELADKLAADGITARRVRTSHAFHSRLMDAAAERFAGFLSGVELRPPRIPMASNVTGALMTDAEAVDPATWARQIRATVRFADELDAVLAEPHRVLIEVGPGGTLTSAAKRHPKFGEGHCVARLVRHPAQDRDDREFFLEGLGRLWAAGLDVETGVPAGHEVLLPGYPFLPERHWVDPLPHRRTGPGEAGAAPQDADAAPDADMSTEAVLGRVFAACLGTDAVDPAADFFDLGGDSLVAIGVSMAAGHAGIDLTPQDLYDHPTVAGLARAITERDAAGGLAEPEAPSERPPLPPDLARIVEEGIRDHARWRVPLVLGVGPEIDAEDVRTVLEALVQRHEALRLELREDPDGLWEQVIGDADDAAAHLALIEERTAAQDLDALARERLTAAVDDAAASGRPTPVTAVLVRPEAGGPGRLALAVPGHVGDARSREILAADLLTAFGQRAAGMRVWLAPPATGWRTWSQRLTGLAGHPAVLATRARWLDALAPAVRLATDGADGAPVVDDYRRLPTVVGTVEAAEVDDARRRTGVRLDELLAAALVRGVHAVAGPGRVAIDVDGDARPVLKPAVDARETVGWFGAVHPVALTGPGDDAALLDEVRTTLREVPHHGVGYGLLRHLHAPTAARLAASRHPDLHLVVIGSVPEPPDVPQGPKAVWFGADPAMPVRDVAPALGHPVELRAYRTGGRLHLDWWYDARRVDADRIEALAAAVADALGVLARGSAEAEDDGDDWDLVDLSGGDA